MGVCVHDYKCIQRPEEGVSEFLELELQVVENYLKWVLGVKLGSSGRAIRAKRSKTKSVYEECLESDTFKEKNEWMEGR